MQSNDKGQWNGNTVGPFQVLRRLRGVTTKDSGKVYTALRRDTGRPALLWRPEELGDWAPGEEWRLRLRGTTEPPYLALEVERAPGGTAPLTELADGLDALAEAMQAVEHHPEAVAHLTGPRPPRRRNPRWQVRAPFAAALTAAALAALLLVPRAEQHEAPAQHAPEASADVAEEALAEPVALPVGTLAARAPWHGVSLDMPRRPFEGQRLAPCEEGDTEVVLRDGSRSCWIGVKYSAATCKTRGYELKGTCYLPSYPPQRPPSSGRP